MLRQRLPVHGVGEHRFRRCRRSLRHHRRRRAGLDQHERQRRGHERLARDAREANAIVAGIARTHDAREVIKVKSMVTDEIGLNDALAAGGGAAWPLR